MKNVAYVIIGFLSIPFFLLGIFLALCWVLGKWSVHETIGRLFAFARMTLWIHLIADQRQQETKG